MNVQEIQWGAILECIISIFVRVLRNSFISRRIVECRVVFGIGAVWTYPGLSINELPDTNIEFISLIFAQSINKKLIETFRCLPF